MRKLYQDILPYSIVLIAFVVFSFIYASRDYLRKDLFRIAEEHAACDVSFLTVSNPVFVKSCIVANQQMYSGDTRYAFFAPTNSPTNPYSYLANAAYVQTQNVQIKDQQNLTWSATLTKPATVYLLTRHVPGVGTPNWIKTAYVRQTNDDLATIPQYFLRKNTDGLIGLYDVWKKSVAAGVVSFQGASDASVTAFSMYLTAFIPTAGTSSTPVPTLTPAPTGAQGSFRFVSWGDTKGGLSILKTLSGQVKNLNPLFTLYAGDLCDSGFNISCITPWKDAMNGGTNNGMFDKTFAVRGNHDKTDSAGWNSYFNFSGVATRVGATHFSGNNLTYSFDYGNSHFVGVDVTGDASGMTTNDRTWMDADLTSAESRGIVHSFLFWHGPVYPVAEHCCSDNSWVTSILNKHPSVSATFHGHEHVYAYVHIDSTRYSNVTHPFEQFVTGDAGAGPNTCKTGRTDYCMQKHGFVTVDVSGRSFTVTMYPIGSTTPEKVWTFTK